MEETEKVRKAVLLLRTICPWYPDFDTLQPIIALLEQISLKKPED